MDCSNYLREDKKTMANKINNIQVCKEVIEEKNDSQKRNFDKINKNLITNDNHLKNPGIIIKAKKMNKFENIKTEKNIEKSIESLYILKYIFSFLSEKQKLEIIIYNKDLQNKLDINIKDYKRKKGIYRS